MVWDEIMHQKGIRISLGSLVPCCNSNCAGPHISEAAISTARFGQGATSDDDLGFDESDEDDEKE